jgi:hypothetical protein
MIEITLTDFVDFVSKAGTPKLTVVKNVKKHHIDGYDPQTDFYRAIRKGIVEMHQKAKPKDALDNLLLGLTDKKKQTAYPELVAGYKKFLGKKGYVWFTPPKHKWEHAGLAISVNPEVGLEFDGVRHVVKPHIFFDDQEGHCKSAAEFVSTARVPVPLPVIASEPPSVESKPQGVVA